jgi:hypothetical protein
VFWGSNVAAQFTNGAVPFYVGLSNSNYFQWFGEYSAYGYPLGGQYTTYVYNNKAFQITPHNTSSTLNDSTNMRPCPSGTTCDIANELKYQFSLPAATRVLPRPYYDTSSRSNLYVIHFPPGVSISMVAGGTPLCSATPNATTSTRSSLGT